MTSYKFQFPYFLAFGSFLPFWQIIRGAGTAICLEGMDSGFSSLEAIVSEGSLLLCLFLYLRKQNNNNSFSKGWWEG